MDNNTQKNSEIREGTLDLFFRAYFATTIFWNICILVMYVLYRMSMHIGISFVFVAAFGISFLFHMISMLKRSKLKGDLSLVMSLGYFFSVIQNILLGYLFIFLGIDGEISIFLTLSICGFVYFWTS